DHCAAHYLRPEPDLVGSADDADVVRRVRAYIDDVGIGGLHGPDYWREIGRARRIALVIDQIEAVLLDLAASTLGCALGELGVCSNDGDCPRLWLLRCGHIKKANRKRIDALRAS